MHIKFVSSGMKKLLRMGLHLQEHYREKQCLG